MILKVESSFQILLALLFLSNYIPIDGLGSDWGTNLEQRRVRVQADVDLLIKYFCTNDQSDVNCQTRLPQLREELRQIDEQLLSYKGVEERGKRSHDNGLINLIRSRSFVQAEQEIMNRLNDVPAVVRDVYDNRIENFHVLVDFASAVRDPKLTFLIYKNLIEELIHRGHDEPIKIVRLLRGLQEEVVFGNFIDAEIQTKATNMIENVKVLFQAAVAKLWIDSNLNQFFERDINVPKLADEISSLDPDLFTRIILQVIAVVYPNIDTDQLMRNMEKFHLVPQMIDSYGAIYSEMTRYNDINEKRFILKLAYYFRELMQRSNSTRIQITPEKKTQLLVLEQKLPVSIRSVIFNDRVCLKNKYVHDYLHIAHGHPRLRRYAVMAPGTQLKWKPKVMDYSVFFEFPYGGYLFSDNEVLDGRNRLVAASQDSDDMAVGSEWKLEPQGDDCLIRNVAYNELLYVGDEFDEDHRSYRVFTTMENTTTAMSNDKFKWTIEKC